jgi:hypothetical protein
MEEIAETWTNRELPILRVALRRFDGGEESVDLGDVQTETGLSADQIWAGIHALRDAYPPYLDFDLAGWTDQANGDITSVSERTRRELGSWPTPENVLESLIQALNAEAESAPEEERSRLRAVVDALGGTAREIAIRVISARIGQTL